MVHRAEESDSLVAQAPRQPGIWLSSGGRCRITGRPWRPHYQSSDRRNRGADIDHGDDSRCSTLDMQQVCTAAAGTASVRGTAVPWIVKRLTPPLGNGPGGTARASRSRRSAAVAAAGWLSGTEMAYRGSRKAPLDPPAGWRRKVGCHRGHHAEERDAHAGDTFLT